MNSFHVLLGAILGAIITITLQRWMPQSTVSITYDEVRRLLDDQAPTADIEHVPCITWGREFNNKIKTNNVLLNCTSTVGKPVCCAAISNIENMYSKSVGNIERTKRTHPRYSKLECRTNRIYVSSIYEKQHYLISLELANISHPGKRKEALKRAILSEEEVRASAVWLSRVHLHMQTEGLPAISYTADDFKYLSYFNVSLSCPGRSLESWIEWIEPLTIHARSPIGMQRCAKIKPDGYLTDTDYLLFKGGRDIVHSKHTKHYYFDAGSSIFSSSMYWIICAYLQRKIHFDGVYAWEMTLLDPALYWRNVPEMWKPFWHFFNVPIQYGEGNADYPLRMIKQVAKPDDFVVFKLDVDNPSVEMPIALEITKNSELISIVDEFFFELHFKCELMSICGWGDDVPDELLGFSLTRPRVLEFFTALREKGIRAHFWP